MKKVEKILKMEMEKVFQRYGYRIKEIDSGCFPSKLLIYSGRTAVCIFLHGKEKKPEKRGKLLDTAAHRFPYKGKR